MPQYRPPTRVLVNPTEVERPTATALTYLHTENICSDLRCLKSLSEDDPFLIIHEFPNQRPLGYKVCESCANAHGKDPMQSQNYVFPKDPTQLLEATDDVDLKAQISKVQRNEVWVLETCAACSKLTSCRWIYYWLEFWSNGEEDHSETGDQLKGDDQSRVDDNEQEMGLPRVEDGDCYGNFMCTGCYPRENNAEVIRPQVLTQRLHEYGIDSSCSGLGKGEGWFSQ